MKHSTRHAERALITRFMPEEDYQRLRRKYGHAKLWNAFAGASESMGRRARFRISIATFNAVQKLRVVLLRFQNWLEA